MTYIELNNKIAELATKLHAGYTYYQFDVGSVPPLPYLVFYYPETNNFGADNIVYAIRATLNIEFYSEKKDFEAERIIEAFLRENEIPWEKEETYIDDENMWETLYYTTVIIDTNENSND